MFRFLLGIFSALLCMQLHPIYRSFKKWIILPYRQSDLFCSSHVKFSFFWTERKKEEFLVGSDIYWGFSIVKHIFDFNRNFCMRYKHRVRNLTEVFYRGCSGCGIFASDFKYDYIHYSYFMKTYLPKVCSAIHLTWKVSHWLYLPHMSFWIPTLQCPPCPW